MYVQLQSNKCFTMEGCSGIECSAVSVCLLPSQNGIEREA